MENHLPADLDALDASRAAPGPSTPTLQLRRYPSALGVGRAAQSKSAITYERLEDLLREAGYKETRIFTPEAERRAQQQQQLPSSDQTPEISSTRGIGSFIVNLFPRPVRTLPAWNSDDHVEPATPTRHGVARGRRDAPGVQASPQRRTMAVTSLRHTHSAPNVKGRPGRPRAGSYRSPSPSKSSVHSGTPFRRACRAATARSQVTATNVLCRSAPSSRSNSRVRGMARMPLPPSLTQTVSVDEPWDELRCESPPSPEYASEEEEVGLEALLMPPKRQQSIRSLRRHLQNGGRRSERQGEVEEEARREWEALGLEWRRLKRGRSKVPWS